MLGALLMGALASCEMKDELAGTSASSSQEMGALELNLSVLEPGSRATDPAANFPVAIACPSDLENPDKNKEFGSYASMTNPVELPVGEYTVSANTPGEMLSVMTAPYYKGSAPMTISAGVTEQVEVECKMANTKISLELPEDFKSFQSWTIQFDDGASHTLTFGTGEDVNGDGSAALYWNLGDTGVPTITMNITATTADGVQVDQSKSFKKADAEESYDDDEENFVGGDALDVKITVTEEPIDPDEPEETKPQISFGITVDATFNNTNESVTIPVTPGVSGGGGTTPEPPTDGDEDALSMQMPSDGHITYTLGGSDQPASADVVITATNGIKSMNVKIVAGNDGFARTISDLVGKNLDFVTNGVEMVGNEIIGEVLGAFLGGASVDAPALGDTSYTFPVGAFFGLMNGYRETAPNAHTFKIALEDQAGNKLEDELQVTINPGE